MPYPKARVDALTEGVYGVAMTLLALDVRIPERQLGNSHELWAALGHVAGGMLPYAISFFILGLRWLSIASVPSRAETVTRAYARWWLANLFFVTLTPFTATLVSRYPGFAPAVWVYAANTAVLCVTSWLMDRQLVISGAVAGHESAMSERWADLAVVFAVSVLVCGIAVLKPEGALLFYLLLLLRPLLSKARETRHSRRREG